MLEVQTIVGRTYAVSHLAARTRRLRPVLDDALPALTSRDVCRRRGGRRRPEAVARTAGSILTFERPARPGRLPRRLRRPHEHAAAVWGGTIAAYLVARGRRRRRQRTRTRVASGEVSADALTAALDADARTRVGGRSSAIDVVARDNAGRAERVALRGRSGTGAAVRARRSRRRVPAGVDAARSAPAPSGARTFDVRRTGRLFTFSGRGFGHGVGCARPAPSPACAPARSPCDVLRYYYPGV